jgi:hypothetical protein
MTAIDECVSVCSESPVRIPYSRSVGETPHRRCDRVLHAKDDGWPGCPPITWSGPWPHSKSTLNGGQGASYCSEISRSFSRRAHAKHRGEGSAEAKAVQRQRQRQRQRQSLRSRRPPGACPHARCNWHVSSGAAVQAEHCQAGSTAIRSRAARKRAPCSGTVVQHRAPRHNP